MEDNEIINAHEFSSNHKKRIDERQKMRLLFLPQNLSSRRDKILDQG